MGIRDLVNAIAGLSLLVTVSFSECNGVKCNELC